MQQKKQKEDLLKDKEYKTIMTKRHPQHATEKCSSLV